MEKLTNKEKRKIIGKRIVKFLLFVGFIYFLIYYFIDSKLYSSLITIGIIFILQIIKNKVRGYFWIDLQGNKLTFKEFMGRFRHGIEGITPLQQVKTQLWCTIPIFAGIIWGAIVTSFAGTWWMTLILVATLPITTIQFIGMLQKYWRFKAVEEARSKIECSGQ